MAQILEDLFQAIVRDPQDDTLRFAYADACEELGDHQRADFIRCQMQLAELGPPRRRISGEVCGHKSGGVLVIIDRSEMPANAAQRERWTRNLRIGERVDVINGYTYPGKSTRENLYGMVVKEIMDPDQAIYGSYLLTRDALSKPYQEGKWKSLRKQENELLRSCASLLVDVRVRLLEVPYRKIAGVEQPITDWSFQRGFVDSITLPDVETWTIYGPLLVDAAPLTHVSIPGLHPAFGIGWASAQLTEDIFQLSINLPRSELTKQNHYVRLGHTLITWARDQLGWPRLLPPTD